VGLAPDQVLGRQWGMSFGRPNPVPSVPTLPQGEVVATYGAYLDAQLAVDYLSDKQFPVQKVTIVGSDLRMVERVTGRLTYPKVAAAGLASGAWFGLFVGLLLALFGGSGAEFSVFVAVFIGAAFGLLFSVLSYMATRRKRDFTSSSQIVAASYAVLCLSDQAGEARRLLVTGGHGGNQHAAGASVPTGGAAAAPYVVPSAPSQTPTAPAAPRPVAPHFLDAQGRPRYGVRLEDVEPPAPNPPTSAPTPDDQAPTPPDAP